MTPDAGPPRGPDVPSTAAICDAHAQLGRPLRAAPAGMAPVLAGARIAGPALPVPHHGSVDVIIEALHHARPGDVAVVANEGRTDEACIGDLIALEGIGRGVAAFVVDGLHRDHGRLLELAVPVFSYGRHPAGPRGARRPGEPVRPGEGPIRFGAFAVTRDDLVVADDDGVVFLAAADAPTVLERAGRIEQAEIAQADRLAAGETLFDLLDFAGYAERRAQDPSYDFRAHLRRVGGQIES